MLTWIINNNFIEQNDIYVDNSILSAPLQQDSINISLYHFKGLISSSGNTKIAGFHFFASDSIQNNRGDSYLVSFDAKNHKVIIYKSLNNVLKIKQISPAAINTDEWYDFKIYCNSNNGTIWVFVNDKFIAAWTDAIPLTYGSYISLRTENSQAAFDEIKVYKNRKSSEIVTIGNSQQNDIRYQSVNSSFNADIFSINIDNEQNISLIDSVKIKIDWTPPLNVSVNDGMASDIDTTNITGQLTANWNLSYDTNSGINKYFVCAGISPYDSSIAMWKDNNLSNTIVFNNVNLSNGQIYYISVKTINNAGLSSISCSDGVLFQDLSSKYYFANIENKNKIFPNPVSDFIYINLSENEKVYYVKIFDNKGSEIIFSDILFNYSSDNTIKLNIKNLNLTTGVYVIVCVTNKNVIKEKFIYPKIHQ